jgi:hypothetical protein
MTAKPDPLIHPITRLSICGLLAAGADWVEFAALRDTAGISDSVLSKQSRVLEDSGSPPKAARRCRVTWPGWPSWRRPSPPAPGMRGWSGPSLAIANTRAACCRLCWAAPELVLAYTASRAFQDRNVTFTLFAPEPRNCPLAAMKKTPWPSQNVTVFASRRTATLRLPVDSRVRAGSEIVVLRCAREPVTGVASLSHRGGTAWPILTAEARCWIPTRTLR